MPAGQWVDITFLQQVTKKKSLVHLAPPIKAMTEAVMVVKHVGLVQRLYDVVKCFISPRAGLKPLRPCEAEVRWALPLRKGVPKA